MNKLIIFDFDGVLADSLQVVFKMNQEAIASVNRSITIEEYASCFEEHINKRLAELLGLTDKQKHDMVEFKSTLFPKYYNSESVNLFPFAKDLIIKTKELGELWIVSSSPSELIYSILEKNGLSNFFSKIIGQNRQPKNLVLQDALGKIKDNQVFFITDTTGDIKETRKINIKILTLAVNWGFHNVRLLKKENPDLIAQKPEDILDYVKSH
ncbi:HAD hydrolase-like protein [Candidatus Gracilibacteria bacterium]|nr:HAD hydrolase-like protein [Candidatus Gracilibacteria bacterium]